LQPPSFIYAPSRAEEPEKLAKFAPSSETWARAAATQARFVSGSATDLFHGSRFSTDRRCKTLGDVLLQPNAEYQNAVPSI